ncbi:MAG: hypothetical protein ACKO4T_04935 [Planctomycetaceae bacterium]
MFWVPLEKVDFTACILVKKLPLKASEAYSGDASGSLRASEPFEFLKASPLWTAVENGGAGLFSAIAAGARLRLLVGDYLGITSPDALRQLLGWMDLAGEKGGWLGGSATCQPPFSVRVAEMENLRGSPDSFHPKSWRIADS